MRSLPHTVTVVVLHYSGVELTLDCLRSLEASTWPDLHVCVVDNASADGGGAIIKERFPKVDVISSGENLGYAGGNNLGLRAALAGDADAVLVLNNDTLVEPTAIGAMVAALEPGVGAVAPLITFAADPTIVWSAGGDYRADRARHGAMTGYRQSVSTVGPPRDTERFTGAAVLFPREALEQVGLFDEELFFLYEDVDLSLRLRAAGWQLRFCPAAVVRHRVAMAQGGEHSATSFYYGVRNQLLVADRHAPARAGTRAARAAATLAVYVARARRAPRPRHALRATFQGLRDYRAGQTGSRPHG